MTPEEKLANAIIELAAEDYLQVLKKKRPTDDDKHDKKRIEDFFKSEWYMALTDVDGEYMIRKLKEEAHNLQVNRPRRKTVDHYKAHKVA